MLTNLYCKVCTYLTPFKNDERGVTAIEYGLIAAAMAALLATAFYADGNFVGELESVFSNIATLLDGVPAEIAK
ncbi:Flp family type IVb pilin [Vibrio splendidus]|uniref:Flp family type IVb pilin n=1 Tax=Vibrio splendidus TaxID=29497 RepID=UPI000C843739|nr:Flp family type IVb pilin [Vibrio splendidus]PMI71106.1 pilus assembly protein [Vibrio splendidus]PMJ93699.1 pilus assembly protein [Vibrio splendidus]PMK61091.1 pilus assembly protein [Vibrio splendidus]